MGTVRGGRGKEKGKGKGKREREGGNEYSRGGGDRAQLTQKTKKKKS